MTDKIIVSKVGARHRQNDVDMMEFIQIEEIREFDLDKHSETLTPDDIESIMLFEDDNDAKVINC